MALYVTKHVKFKAYGEGDAPVFRGSVEVQNETWTDEGAGLYSLVTGYPVQWLQIDGQNAKQASTDWIDILDLPATNQVEVDPLDLTGLDVIGAYAVCFNRPWSLSRGHLVTNYASGVITIRRDHGYLDRSWVTAANAIESGHDGRLKLFGLSSYITNNYDWAFEGGTLYIKLPSAPSNFVIRAIKEDAAIKIKAADVEVTGIDVVDYHRSGIILYKHADRAWVHHNKIHSIREDGVRVTDRNDSIQVVDNEIFDCDNRGVYLPNIENSKINRNHIYNIGVGVNDYWLKDSTDVNHYTGMGITQSGGLTLGDIGPEQIEINDNYIHDTAWCGIHYFKANGEILRNRVVRPLQKTDDGGGIYLAWGYLGWPSAPVYACEVAYNRISEIPQGAVLNGTRGIYQDNGSGPNEVHHNVIWDADVLDGLFANSGSSGQNWHHNIVITKNGNPLRHRFVEHAAIPGLTASGVLINNNVFISLVANKECIRIDGNVFINGGESDNNYFFQPYSAGDVAYNNLTLAQWQAVYGQDANSRSKSNWLTYVNELTAETIHIKLYTNDTDTDITQLIPAGYEDVDGNDVSNQTLTVPAYYGLVVLKSTN